MATVPFKNSKSKARHAKVPSNDPFPYEGRSPGAPHTTTGQRAKAVSNDAPRFQADVVTGRGSKR